MRWREGSAKVAKSRTASRLNNTKSPLLNLRCSLLAPGRDQPNPKRRVGRAVILWTASRKGSAAGCNGRALAEIGCTVADGVSGTRDLHRWSADPAVADDHRGDSFRQLGPHAGANHAAIVVPVYVKAPCSQNVTRPFTVCSAVSPL
jgi:hypothetical protein